MKSTAANFGVQQELHAQVRRATEPFLARLLRALVASHEFSLLMPDYDGAMTFPGRRASAGKGGRVLSRTAPRSCSSGNPSPQGVRTPSEQ